MTIHQDPELVLTLQRVIEFIGTFAFALSGIHLPPASITTGWAALCVAWLLPSVAEPSAM